MGMLNRVIGNADVNTADLSMVQGYFFQNEQVIQSFKFFRDSIILTNYGLYHIDVKGLTGKRVNVHFFPKQTIKAVSFQSAGHIDFDVEIKILVDCNPGVENGVSLPNVPIKFDVVASQATEAKQVVMLVKQYYLCSY